jgi:hypothetical protein
MQRFSSAWLLIATIVGAGCGQTADDPPIDPFVGRWSCAETRTLTFTTPASSPEAKSMSRFNVNSAVADGQLSLFTATDAGVSCRLNFKTEGSTSAVILADQSCATNDGITLTYTAGNADVGATGLHTSLMFDFAGALTSSDGGSPLDSTGSGTSTSLCSRLASSGGSGGPSGGGGW